jgi:hypothetical protein
MLQNSPLQDGHWGDVQSAADEAISILPGELKVAFRISVLLGSEVYATSTAGQLTREVDTARAFLTVDFAATVANEMKEVVEYFPYLVNLKLHVAGTTSLDAVESIDTFWQDIGRLLRDPGNALGYLGLVLDRPHGRVCRNGQCEPLTRPLLWRLLVRLERSGSYPCERATLMMAWGNMPHEHPQDETLDRAISDLRPVLVKLGIRIPNTRKNGLRLEEISMTTLKTKKRARRRK